MRTVIILLSLGVLALAGCMAPSAIREAQAWEQVAMQNHMANDARQLETFITIYRLARQADIEFTTTMFIDEATKQGWKPEMVVMLITKRDKAKADTEVVCGKLREMAAINQSELAKALRIHGKLADWMAAGIDESAVPIIAQELVHLVGTMKGESK